MARPAGGRGYHRGRSGENNDMDVQELIQRGYRAVGLGADDDVLALFDQLGAEPAA